MYINTRYACVPSIAIYRERRTRTDVVYDVVYDRIYMYYICMYVTCAYQYVHAAMHTHA
jgi:hypothetical protein